MGAYCCKIMSVRKTGRTSKKYCVVMKKETKIVSRIQKGTYLILCLYNAQYITPYISEDKVLKNKQTIIGVRDKALIVLLGHSCPTVCVKSVKSRASTLRVTHFTLCLYIHASKKELNQVQNFSEINNMFYNFYKF